MDDVHTNSVPQRVLLSVGPPQIGSPVQNPGGPPPHTFTRWSENPWKLLAVDNRVVATISNIRLTLVESLVNGGDAITPSLYWEKTSGGYYPSPNPTVKVTANFFDSNGGPLFPSWTITSRLIVQCHVNNDTEQIGGTPFGATWFQFCQQVELFIDAGTWFGC
jgi:hypothetical protein